MEQIDIMPIKQGSGPAGTRELLSTGKPLLAALNLTPIGRGILGAIGTMASIPEETEAGIFTNIGKYVGKTAKLVSKEGLAIFPDNILVHEIPTSHWTNVLNTDTMASAVKNLKVGDISKLPEKAQIVASNRLSDIKAAELIPIDKRLSQSWGLSDATNAFYGHREAAYPKGLVAIREGIPSEKFEASLVHEYTHLGDEASSVTREAFKALDMDAIPYSDRVTEVKAFTAGSRAGFPETLTSPSSSEFVHPLISYTDGKFSSEPFARYVNALRAEGRSPDMEELFKYSDEITKEVGRLTMKAREDPLFKRKLDEAVAKVPLHYEDWVFSTAQKKARGKARVEAYRKQKGL